MKGCSLLFAAAVVGVTLVCAGCGKEKKETPKAPEVEVQHSADDGHDHSAHADHKGHDH